MVEQNQTSNETAKESIKIFEEVNLKISGLIECSVKDFESLNTNFKDFYKNLEDTSTASKNFISFLLDLTINEDFIEIQTRNDLSALDINTSINDYLSYLKKINTRTNYFHLLLNNLIQDLSTIRLLFTNLKFDPLINEDFTIFNKNINSIEQCFKHLEKDINNLNYSLNEAIKFVEEGFVNTLGLISEQLKHINDCYFHLNQLGKQGNKHLVVLNNLEAKRSTSTSEIITNLQFQDILRQKIEHVQHAHEDITSDLKKAQSENNNLKPEELFKIRDITTLQSAQLIYSNQEYQNAVETILNKINELNTFLNKYLAIWNHFCKPGNIELKSLNAKLETHIPLFNTQSLSLSNITNEFDALTEKLSTHFEAIFRGIRGDNLLCSSLFELQKRFVEFDKQFSAENRNNAVLQIESELQKFECVFNKLSAELGKLHITFKENKITLDSGIKKDIKFIEDLSEKNLTFLNKTLVSKISDLSKDSFKFDTNSNFNVKEVTYYKIFESEIKEIIELFDGLLEIINVNKSDIDKKRLEHLKELYTMDSERKIHNLIVGVQDENKKNKKKDKTDEIEFF